LGEGHAQELIQAGKAFDVSMPIVLGHQSPKGMQRQVLHELGKDEATLWHDDPRLKLEAASLARIGDRSKGVK
jgi:hypothetical protein